MGIEVTRAMEPRKEAAMTMEYTSELQRHLDVRYSKMYLSLIDKLYVCDEFGLTSTAALTVFMKAVVRERRIPFDIRTVSECETRRKALEAFERMREDAAQSGLQGMSLDEINSIIREVR